MQQPAGSGRRPLRAHNGGPSGQHVPVFGRASMLVPGLERRFRVEVQSANGAFTVTPHGELDAAAVPVLEADILAAIEQAHSVLLDLGRLTFIDSCGLWLITLTLSSCRRSGVSFKLTRGSESIRSIFEVTGLSDVLPFVDEEPAAQL